MIHFITKRKESSNYSNLPLSEVLFELAKLDMIGFDFEATDLDPYIAQPLLLILGDAFTQYVIDLCSYKVTEFQEILNGKCIIGANLKYDVKLGTVNGLKFDNIALFDIIVADQRIWQGY